MADGLLVLTEDFERALGLLDAGSNLFLTGKAGTGKSTLIRHFLERTPRRVLVAAPTGIAALNVGGYTIHRLFSFGARTTLDDVDGGGYRPQRFARALASLDTLIIDEVSMVRADLFDMLVIALERFGPEPGQPFGGVQIVLVGDLHQLPPVVTDAEAGYFTSRYESPYFFSADRYRRADFPTVDLMRQFRQADDARLSSILDGIRAGVLTGAALADLDARADAVFTPPDDEFWLTLAATNAIVGTRNRERLERLAGEEFAHFAERVGELELFEPPTDDELRFKVGAQVMMLNNDPQDRWVNGTLGRITYAAWTLEGCVVTVDFTNGEQAQVCAHKWEATRPVIDGGRLRHDVIGSYTQLPFKLAWAITIHKSQGQTIERMVVDLTGGTFASGQLYVALSRSTSLDGLVLTRAVRPRDLKTDRRITRFLQEATADARPRRYCEISVRTVGEDGRLARPRPVEIAIAFEDGSATSTLVNPQRDAGQARLEHGIAAADLMLAPTLAQAWAALAPRLAGWTPMGVGVDRQMGLIDHELKRLGVVAALPLGVEVRAHTALGDAEGGEAFGKPEPGVGYLLGRGLDLGAALFGGEGDRDLIAAQVREAAGRAPLPPELLARLRAAEALFGVDLGGGQGDSEAGPDIAGVLVPGARVCFSGTAVAADGRVIEREQLIEMATARGLAPVNSVTKSKCEALVTAEVGSQSGKARKALDYGKPVYSADEFLAWAR